MPAPLRIWLNQAYRGAYRALAMMREGARADGLELHIVGSHTEASSPFLQSCDDAFAEPEHVVGEDWADTALTICLTRGIEVFVPGREREVVARHADRFAAEGIRLMTSGEQALRVLADKQSSNQAAVELGVDVPETRVARTAQEFRAAYAELRGLGVGVCIKPALDHGGHGFRELDESAGTLADLLSPPSVRVHPDEVERLLATVAEFPPLLVGELLDGPELSIDTLSDRGTLLAAVPRSKDGPKWTRTLVDDPQALAVARTLVEGHGLSYLNNVQLRYGGGRLCLLEINTRMSSGLFHTEASGLNLPYLALRLLLDGSVEVGTPRTGATVLTYTAAAPVELPF